MRLESTNNTDINTPQGSQSLEIGGRLIPLSNDGFLIDLADWSEEVAASMAQADEVPLGDDHWTLINFLHRFYKEFEVPPDMDILSRNLCKDQSNCRWSKSYIFELFPEGAKMACRYAGLPAPLGRCP